MRLFLYFLLVTIVVPIIGFDPKTGLIKFTFKPCANRAQRANPAIWLKDNAFMTAVCLKDQQAAQTALFFENLRTRTPSPHGVKKADAEVSKTRVPSAKIEQKAELASLEKEAELPD